MRWPAPRCTEGPERGFRQLVVLPIPRAPPYTWWVLVGYEAERTRLAELVAAAEAGHGGALALLGDGGTGKSALCEELAASARCGVLRARGLESEAPVPFAALFDVLAPLRGRIGHLPRPQAAAIRAALALAPPATGDRLALGLAVLNLLAAEGPAVVVVDDAHWIDGSSLAVLAFVARRLHGHPVAMLLAARPEGPVLDQLRGVEVRRLEGLSADAATALLAERGAAVDDAVAVALWRATRGTPLALIEIAGALPAASLNGVEPLPDPLPAGGRLLELYRGEIDGLPSATRDGLLLVAASEGGIEVLDVALASAHLSWPDLEPAEQAGLVRVTPAGVTFRHPLVRAAVYHGASDAERRRAHARLAHASADPDRQVWHRAEATVGPDSLLAAELRAAADRALRRGGYAEAATALWRAALATPDRGERLEAQVAAARAWHLAGNPERALGMLENLAAEVADPVERARVEELRAAVLMWTGPLRPVRDLLRAEADRVEDVSAEQAARMRSLASVLSTMLGEVREGVGLARRAWEVQRNGGPSEVAQASAVLALGLLLVGERAEGERLAATAAGALAALSADQAGVELALSGHALMLAERWDESVRFLYRIIEHARRHQGPAFLSTALAMLADVQIRQGRLHEALAGAAEAVDICEEVGSATERTHALVVLAHAKAVLGDETARDHAEEALARAREQDAGALEPFAHHALGLLHLAHGRDVAAIAHLEEAGRLTGADDVVDPIVVPWARDLVEALVRTGDLIRAAAVSTELSARATGAGPWVRAIAARCHGLLGGDDAEDHLRSALEELPPEHAPYEAARTALVLGELLRRQLRRREAREHLARALGIFERLGAEPWAKRARGELRAAGGVPPLPATGTLTTLTPQELRVALRVADGDTNREVAAALYLSPKTVENTLTRAYRKLGVRSRTELARIIDSGK